MTLKQLRDVNVSVLIPLPSPRELYGLFPVTPAMERRIMGDRQQILDIVTGKDKRLLVIVGPCSVHDERAAYEYACRLHALALQVQGRMLLTMRVYFEKPRTILGWKGLIVEPNLNGVMDISEGLLRARKFLCQIVQLGLPVATEWLDPIVPQYIADLVSWGAIGARTTESQTHRQLASGLSMPVGFKNGTGGTRHSIQIAVNGMAASRNEHAFLGTDEEGRIVQVCTRGNPGVHLVLRGGEQGPNYDRQSIDAACTMLAKVGFNPAIVVDCSHDNSRKDHTRQSGIAQCVLEERKSGAGIAGLMIESHLFPGKQALNGNRASLQYGVSITDACIGWEETERLLCESYEQLQ